MKPILFVSTLLLKGSWDRIIESIVFFFFFVVLDIFFEFRLVNFVNAVLRTGH